MIKKYYLFSLLFLVFLYSDIQGSDKQERGPKVLVLNEKGSSEIYLPHDQMAEHFLTFKNQQDFKKPEESFQLYLPPETESIHFAQLINIVQQPLSDPIKKEIDIEPLFKLAIHLQVTGTVAIKIAGAYCASKNVISQSEDIKDEVFGLLQDNFNNNATSFTLIPKAYI